MPMNNVTNIDAKELTVHGITAYLSVVAEELYRLSETEPEAYRKLRIALPKCAEAAALSNQTRFPDLEATDRATIVELQMLLDLLLESHEQGGLAKSW